VTLADALLDHRGDLMNIRDILTLYDYNYWATRRLLAASKQVSPAQFLAPTAHSFGSLRGTLTHTLDSERAWRIELSHLLK
jgi:uncharacterized damage-inducible protein DinB